MGSPQHPNRIGLAGVPTGVPSISQQVSHVFLKSEYPEWPSEHWYIAQPVVVFTKFVSPGQQQPNDSCSGGHGIGEPWSWRLARGVEMVICERAMVATSRELRNVMDGMLCVLKIGYMALYNVI